MKILVFGEFSLLNHISSSFTFNQPDLGLFLFDVGSDIYNGVNFIDDGNPIWGAVILGVIFIPMTVLYVGIAIKVETSSPCEKLLILLLAPILAVPAIPIMTVGYIVYVAYVFARKCVQPGFHDKDEEHKYSWAGMFKLLEAVAEANLQAVLGLFPTKF